MARLAGSPDADVENLPLVKVPVGPDLDGTSANPAQRHAIRVRDFLLDDDHWNQCLPRLMQFWIRGLLGGLNPCDSRKRLSAPNLSCKKRFTFVSCIVKDLVLCGGIYEFIPWTR
jgi:hypothetical protein